MKAASQERFFSVELKSRASPNNVKLDDTGPENVLLEGIIDHLKQAEFAEKAIPIVTGEKGILGINLAEEDKKKSISGGDKQ